MNQEVITDQLGEVGRFRHADGLLGLFVEHVPAALAMFDRDMRYLLASRRWRSDFGLGERPLEGVCHYEIFPETPGRWREVYSRGLSGEVIKSEADRFEHADGSVHWQRWEVYPWKRENGEVGGIVVFFEDITALMQMQEELTDKTRQLEEFNRTLEQRIASAVEDLNRKNQLLVNQSRLAAMGDMVGNIAHQWRQPLNNIGLLLQVLPFELERGQLDSASLKGTVAECMKLIRYMSQTIDDFRRYFRPDRDKQLFSVHEAVQRAVSIVRAGLESHGIAIEVEDCGAGSITGYFNEYSQVILNLVSNAREALIERREKGGRIMISCGRNDERAVVTVRDNGGGIDPEILPRVFEPYFTTKHKSQGTGLGLYMAKMIIEENMSGQLTVRNRDDGTEFRVEV